MAVEKVSCAVLTLCFMLFLCYAFCLLSVCAMPVFCLILLHDLYFLCPPNPKGWGTYCFWWGSRRRRCRRQRPRLHSFSVHYLLNHFGGFYQTCTHCRERKRIDYILVTLILFSGSQPYLEMSEIWFPCAFF